MAKGLEKIVSQEGDLYGNIPSLLLQPQIVSF